MIETLVDKLIGHNIRLELLEADKIKVHADMSKVPPELLQEIKSRKADLIRYLQASAPVDDFERIAPAPESDSYALSATQRRLWILGQFGDSNAAYNVPRAYCFEGMLETAALRFAFQTLVARHESLRTVFRENAEGEVRQYILSPDALSFNIGFRDVRQEKNRDVLVQQLVQDSFTAPFDLATGPLLRAGLYQVENDQWIFTYTIHHIISDGWSMGILMNELLLCYNAYLKGEGNPFPQLRVQYKDYAAWQQQQLSGALLEAHKSYWLRQFEGEVPVLDLPGDQPRPVVKTYNGSVFNQHISLAVAQGIRAVGQEQGATLFMTLLAAVNVLLYRYTGQEDIVIGTPVAGREHIDLEGQIGFYANTLALRTRFEGTQSFRDLLEITKTVTLGAYRHQVFPFDELVDALHLQRDRSRNPLFDIQVIVQNAEQPSQARKPTLHHLSISNYGGADNLNGVFDLVFNFVEDETGLRTNIVYNTDVYTEAVVARLAAHLEQLLSAIVAAPGAPVMQPDFLLPAEKAAQLQVLLTPPPVYPAGTTLIGLLERQALATPGAPAVVFEGVTLSYAALMDKVNRLAFYLQSGAGVVKGEMVGVLCDRSDKWIVSLLAIMKAGAVYVPVHPAYPAARKAFILKDTGIKTLLTQTAYIFDLGYFTGNIFATDVQLDGLDAAPAHSFAPVLPEDLAYVIYTSGSTGEPKGVMITQGAAAASILAQQLIFKISTTDRCLQSCSVSFDVSVFEIFICLLSGAALCVVPETAKDNPNLFTRFVNDEAVTLASIPPAYLRLLALGDMPSLKKLITGGEAPVTAQVAQFIQQGIYYNAYGPTENALCTSVYEITREDQLTGSIPIGKPMAGVTACILDPAGNLLPAGIAGELHIGGICLAKGYLNNPVLSAEKFIDHPFITGEKLYRTGDLARWMPDGQLQFIGRKDNQVKINGHRIELGEIEKALSGLPGIAGALVMARTDAKGVKALAAYVTSDSTPDLATVRNALGQLLPPYMVPQYIVPLTTFPLTTNGKTDTRRLPDPFETGVVEIKHTAPRNTLEIQLAAIWEDILGVQHIGVKDDYFELGGSSLKAMIVVKRMMDDMHYTLPLKVLFEEKTIENVVRYLQNNKSSASSGRYIPAAHPHVDAASWNQLNYFSTWNKNDDLVTIDFPVEKLDVHALAKAVTQLAERHEMLRTAFVLEGNVVQQKIMPADAVSSAITLLPGIVTETELDVLRAAQYQLQFDLAAPPLFRITVAQSGVQHYHLLFTLHHIITDGHSGGILRDELSHLYMAALQQRTPSLPTLPFQYRDFSTWQHHFVQSADGAEHLDYWRQKLEGFTAGVQMPGSGQESIAPVRSIVGVHGMLDPVLFEASDRFSKEEGLTRTALLMGVLLLSFHEWTRQRDLTLFTTVSGRNSRFYGELEVGGLIGFFSNLLMVRNVIEGASPVNSFLHSVQQNFLDDLSHDDYPFSKLVEELPGISPATFLQSTVFYNYHNYSHLHNAVYAGDAAEQEVRRAGEMPVDLAFGLAVSEYQNCLTLNFMFSEQSFNPAQRNEFRQLFYQLLAQVVESPALLICDLESSENSNGYKKSSCVQCSRRLACNPEKN